MQLVIKINEQVTTNTVLVAKKFGKRHDDVLKIVKNLKCSDEFRARNFADSSYKSLQNKNMPMHILTKDGFSLLVMSFTGEKATTFKVEFINEFNRMEAVLKSELTPTPLLQVYTKRIISDEARNCPETHFCIFNESHPVMIGVEVNVGSQCKFDLIDGSIGTHWRKYREDKLWADDENVSTYDYVFSDHRGTHPVKCYDNCEWTFFKHWLKHVYKKEHLPKYLRNKYSDNPFMLKRVEAFIPKLLKAS